jgi:hypothetical protein
MLWAQSKTLEGLNGSDGYFKTYDDFLHNRAVQFDKLLRFKFNGPIEFTFVCKGVKNKFKDDELWGYRYKGTLYRVVPFGWHIASVVCIGDMILYGNPIAAPYVDKSATHFFYTEGYDQGFFSKDLNSEVTTDITTLKSAYTDINNDLFTCKDKIYKCYLTYISITYARTEKPFGPSTDYTYIKIDHQVDKKKVEH